MNTITTYQFSELEKDIQEQVLDKNRDINIDHDWWDYIYDDAVKETIECNEYFFTEDGTRYKVL